MAAHYFSAVCVLSPSTLSLPHRTRVESRVGDAHHLFDTQGPGSCPAALEAPCRSPCHRSTRIAPRDGWQESCPTDHQRPCPAEKESWGARYPSFQRHAQRAVYRKYSASAGSRRGWRLPPCGLSQWIRDAECQTRQALQPAGLPIPTSVKAWCAHSRSDFSFATPLTRTALKVVKRLTIPCCPCVNRK